MEPANIDRTVLSGAATLEAVVDHYDTTFALGLTPLEKSDLVEFLKSL